jgi:hypothetical protein
MTPPYFCDYFLYDGDMAHHLSKLEIPYPRDALIEIAFGEKDNENLLV